MREAQQPLFSRKNAFGMVIGLLIGIMLWFWWNAGTRETRAKLPPQAAAAKTGIDLVEFAVRRARSWRVTTQGTSDGQRFQTDQDVFCPYQKHTVTFVKDASGRNTLEEEFIETEDATYARKGDDAWIVQSRPATDQCQVGPLAGTQPLIATLDRIKNEVSIRKTDPVKFQGKSCRIWELISNQSNSRVADLCVEDLTHLPYEFREGRVQVEFANWNEPILIAAPDVPSLRQNLDLPASTPLSQGGNR